MTLHLSEADRAMLAGEHGEAACFAMSILVRIAEVRRATSMLDITQAHIDSTLYQGEATLEYVEHLASMGARVVVPTTLNVSGVDEHGWRQWPVPPEWAEKAHRQMVAYEGMGAVPTWTCTPYQVALPPKPGQQIAWGESNAVAFANSVCGARTERYPDLMDVCAAITGRVPAAGLHLTENRAGEVLFRLDGIPVQLQEDDTFMPALGYLVGKVAQERVCVVDGLEIKPGDDKLKALCAAVASAGAVGLVHLVGITPEAPTLREALQGREPLEEHRVDLDMLRGARDELSTAEGEELDMVALGSPHFSLAEFRTLDELIRGLRVHDDVRFLVTSNRVMVELARAEGLIERLEEFGGTTTVDTCILTTPMMPEDVGVLMTNSAKYAYYGPGLLGARVAFGSIEDCVRSAVAGLVRRDSSVWADAGIRGSGGAADVEAGPSAGGGGAW